MVGIPNIRRNKILAAMVGGVAITAAAAWMPMLTQLLESYGFAPNRAEVMTYLIFFAIFTALSYLFLAELIKVRVQKKRYDEVLNTSMLFELHDKQLFFTMGKKQIHLAKRNGWSVSMIALAIGSVNSNKRVPDISSYIKEIVVKELEGATRCSDLVGSFAKNEYLIFLQNCNKESAVKIAERFKKQFSKRYVTIEDKVYKLECKCGIASLESASIEFKRLTELAYEAMDRAAEKRGSVIERI